MTEPLASLPMDGVRVLDPTRPHVGRYDDRWMVQENLGQRRSDNPTMKPTPLGIESEYRK